MVVTYSMQNIVAIIKSMSHDPKWIDHIWESLPGDKSHQRFCYSFYLIWPKMQRGALGVERVMSHLGGMVTGDNSSGSTLPSAVC